METTTDAGAETTAEAEIYSPPAKVMGVSEALRRARRSLREITEDEVWAEGVGYLGRLEYTRRVLFQLAKSQLRCRRGLHQWVPVAMVGGVLESVSCVNCEVEITPEEWFEIEI